MEYFIRIVMEVVYIFLNVECGVLEVFNLVFDICVLL